VFSLLSGLYRALTGTLPARPTINNSRRACAGKACTEERRDLWTVKKRGVLRCAAYSEPGGNAAGAPITQPRHRSVPFDHGTEGEWPATTSPQGG
jgi:hypothetical protein